MVAIHGVIPTNDGGKASAAQFVEGFLHGSNIGLCTSGRGIAAIQKGMQIDMFRTAFHGQFDHGANVLFMAVDTAVGEQTENVYGAISFNT